jgi:hypothetical protein
MRVEERHDLLRGGRIAIERAFGILAQHVHARKRGVRQHEAGIIGKAHPVVGCQLLPALDGGGSGAGLGGDHLHTRHVGRGLRGERNGRCERG